MAKLERTLNGDFHSILNRIFDGILNGSFSASLEESSDFKSGDAIMSSSVSLRITTGQEPFMKPKALWLPRKQNQPLE